MDRLEPIPEAILRSVTVKKMEGQRYSMQVGARQHQLVSDEPESSGGDDLGMAPYDLLLSALGSCTAITLLMYAERKQWPVEDVSVQLTHDKVNPNDVEGFSEEDRAAAGTSG